MELLIAEYGQSLHAAAFRFPLRAAFALLAPRAERSGLPATHATHGDRAYLEKRAEVDAWLHEHFLIVPNPSK